MKRASVIAILVFTAACSPQPDAPKRRAASPLQIQTTPPANTETITLKLPDQFGLFIYDAGEFFPAEDRGTFASFSPRLAILLHSEVAIAQPRLFRIVNEALSQEFDPKKAAEGGLIALRSEKVASNNASMRFAPERELPPGLYMLQGWGPFYVGYAELNTLMTEKLAQAEQLFAAGNFDAAAASFQEIGKIRPDAPQIAHAAAGVARAKTAAKDKAQAARAKAKAAAILALKKRISIDCSNGVKIDFVQVPAGEFEMGDTANSNEGPRHTIALTREFWMGIHEVTQEQYQAVMGNNPARFEGKTRPVENVSWDDCQEFCKKLSAVNGKQIRLPTEAEWEYACRAGSTTRFCFGDDDVELCNYGNYCDVRNTNKLDWQDTVNSDGHDKTAPAGSFIPNAFGLFDMHGNVWEWCQDWHADDYYKESPRENPQGPVTGKFRSMRGGSWYYPAEQCRSARRSWSRPDAHFNGFGFRVVMETN